MSPKENRHRFDIRELAPERQFKAVIEYLPMAGTPPSAIAVINGTGNCIGYLDLENIRSVLAKFDDMERSYLDNTS